MTNHRVAVVTCVVACLLAVSFFVTTQVRAAENDETIWTLERAYWRYVQDNDLTAYLALWHRDFLGWPAMSTSPVRKDHITDWITSQTSNGLAFKFVEFKPATVQITGDVAVICYWITYKWVDKNGVSADRTSRITHTWVKSGQNWQIIGGMSMPEPVNPPQQ